MKILGIRNTKSYTNIPYKGKKNDYIQAEAFCLGYDDKISSARREYIREHFETRLFGSEYGEKYNGRLEEYELKKLIGSLVGYKVSQDTIKLDLKAPKQKHVNSINPEESLQRGDASKINRELMANVYAYNVSPIWGSESYRGAMCDINKENLAALKQAGIKRIIDLAGYCSEDMCKEAGLEYLSYPMGKAFYKSKMFTDKDDIVRTNTRLYGEILGMDENSVKKAVNDALEVYKKHKQADIERFISFIQTMQKDNVYIGCELGTYETDTALMFNYLFNPEAKNTPSCIKPSSLITFGRIKNLYKNLTAENKKELGWNEEFDKDFIPKLKAIEKSYGY